jgi:hypothetical protein
MLDNGAFSAWQKNVEIDWRAWRAWAEPWLDYPTTWCVLPDSIEGDEAENERLLKEWPLEKGVPVWHLHESLERLASLVDRYGRVCFGSSGVYATPGSEAAAIERQERAKFERHACCWEPLTGPHHPVCQNADDPDAPPPLIDGQVGLL